MKRRTFIGVAAGAAIGSVIPTVNAKANSNRLFGVPRSLLSPGEVEENKLRLSMSHAKLPVEIWEDIIAYNRFWETIKQQPELVLEYRESPEKVLNEFGIDKNIVSPGSSEELLLFITYDKELMDAVKTNNYEKLFSRLKTYGLNKRKSNLRSRINYYLSQDANLVAHFKDYIPLEQPESSPLIRLKEILEPVNNKDDTRLTAGANMVAAINMAVVVTVQTSTTVNVSTTTSVSAFVLVTILTKIAGKHRVNYRPQINHEDISVSAASLHLARIYHNRAMVDTLVRETIRREVIACLFAAQKCGYINLPVTRTERKEVIHLFTELSLEMMIT
ncbi:MULTISPECIES: hypothetical protein [Photorhabdus]|uniref:Uncharacterized protein n=2 Tax=Photorhabdus asymbiotica TaxID=291112 RepID=C7BGY0_PHOAA|nr:hypothetical protein [Photorhabdus asymbiotica]RKS66200.1 hypothetical protein BDD30_0487 [Photorhabdus asymbiotica]CAQ83902.1 conserved hypothetical protein [Photorhabdus asymbiotica]